VATRAQAATRDAILVTAAEAFASRDDVSMTDVAAKAGVARGTLYRYFPTRRDLLGALERSAREEAARRLAEAKLDQVTVDEGLARAIRALVVLDRRYRFLLSGPHISLRDEPGFAAPIIALLERARERGELRADVPVACLVESLLALIGACISSGKAVGMGSEDVSLTAFRLFVGGARPEPR
jgi:TetR/AcrR family transcriptional regulator, mexCD-oprJ operon repressor